jgi:N-acetylglutamate synthase/N-acetylornithine aminotransferase
VTIKLGSKATLIKSNFGTSRNIGRVVLVVGEAPRADPAQNDTWSVIAADGQPLMGPDGPTAIVPSSYLAELG